MFRNQPRPAALDMGAMLASSTIQPRNPGARAVVLIQRTARSFDVSHTGRLIEDLQSLDYYAIPQSAHPAEIARLRRGAALAIVYGQSDGPGSLLVQGAAWAAAAAELVRLIGGVE